MFSIIIPTLNNLEYLRFCIYSIKKNSRFNHEIIPHVNIGNDGTLDSYGAGIQIREVKMQKVDPPSAVIDSFRDVQAARADQERARNEANAYANKVVPEAQGESEKIRRESEAYQSQTVAEAEGQAKRFVSIYSEYIEAKDVTRQRLFLETMEKVFNDMNKVIIDSDAVGGQGVLPYLPLNEVRKKGDQ